MTLKVIYTECSCQPWYDVAAAMRESHGWEPIYWTGAEAVRGEIVGRFPSVTFHDNYEAARGIPALPFADLPLPALDEEVLREFATVESIALRMMDRMEPDETFTYWQRVRLYHRHLRYWTAILDQLRPDVVVFPSSPHLVYDYVLYALCKQRGVRTALVKETGVNGLLFIQDKLDEMHAAIDKTYSDLLSGKHRDGALGERSRRYLAKIRGDYEQAKPAYLEPFLSDKNRASFLASAVEAESKAKRRQSSLTRAVGRLAGGVRDAWHLSTRLFSKTWKALRALRLAASITIDVFKKARYDYPTMVEAYESTRYIYDHVDKAHAFICGPTPAHYLVRAGEKPEDKNWMTGLEYRLYRRLATRKKDYLAGYYNKLCTNVDFSKPYIFVALNYQCECSTSPDGGQFVELTLMVRLLSELAPAGWQLYVKEHPAQFHSLGSGESARTQQFYDDLAAVPNVCFVPLTTTPFDLIDNARAVATVNGTSGLEAVIRGKPTLLFGHAWYKGCEGVFYTPTRDTCRVALERITAGYRPEYAKVELFLRAIELCGAAGGTLPEYVEAFALSHQENVAAFASALAAEAPPKIAA